MTFYLKIKDLKMIFYQEAIKERDRDEIEKKEEN